MIALQVDTCQIEQRIDGGAEQRGEDYEGGDIPHARKRRLKAMGRA